MNIINSSSFKQEVIQSDLPVLVDFFADWCGPCRMLGPILEQIAGQYDGKVKFVKLNVDQAPDIAASFGNNSIPALLYFRDGKVRGTSVGLISREDLERKLNAWGNA